MTKVRILRTATLDALRANVADNLSRYREGDFSYLMVDSSHYRELACNMNHEVFGKLCEPKDGNLFEVENCLIMQEALSELSSYEARDERLWAYVTHTYMLDHVRMRWPIPEDNDVAVAHILKHFFARDKRQVERDNAASRLWWIGNLCKRVEGLALKDALTAFLYKSDVRANIIERPTSSQSVALFGSILRKLHESLSGEKALFERATFRAFMSYINSVGGFKLLDCLDEQATDALIEEVVSKKMCLPKL